MPAERAIQLLSPFTVEDFPEDTLRGLSGSGEVTGYTAIGLDTSLLPGLITSRIIAGTSPLRVNGGASADLGATNITLTIEPATTLAPGSLSAADKLVIDNVALLAAAVVAPTPDTVLLRGSSGEGKCTSFEASSGGKFRFNISGTDVTGLTCDGSQNLIVGDPVQAESMQLLVGTNKSILGIVTGTGTVGLAGIGASSTVALSTNSVNVVSGVGGVLSLDSTTTMNFRLGGSLLATLTSAGFNSPRYKTITASPASVGVFAAANADSAVLTVRNVGDSGDIVLAGNSADTARYGSNSANVAFLTNAGGAFSYTIDATAALSIKATGIEFPANTANAKITTAASTSATTLTLKGANGANGMSGNGRNVAIEVGDPFDGTFSPGNLSINLGTGTGDLSGSLSVAAGAQNLLTGQYNAGTGLFSLSFDTSLTIIGAGTTTINAAEDQLLRLSYNGTPRIEIDNTGIGVFGHATAGQQADIGALTDNSGGTANNTIEALPDPADSPASADALRDDLVANLIPALRNNCADFAEQLNALRAVVRAHGWMA